ncbi:MAG: DUF2339 domain-containing protein [Oscillospiraceae bacterium]|nr:DUF2339 domain-containing protein [Oscillospiraceae bacterium]
MGVLIVILIIAVGIAHVKIKLLNNDYSYLYDKLEKALTKIERHKNEIAELEKRIKDLGARTEENEPPQPTIVKPQPSPLQAAPQPSIPKPQPSQAERSVTELPYKTIPILPKPPVEAKQSSELKPISAEAKLDREGKVRRFTDELNPIPTETKPITPEAKITPEPKTSTTAETWLGQKLFGIIAAVLIFIGLIFLGTLIYERIDDNGKIALMYVISFALTLGGAALMKKHRNYFTLALTGCGCGALFISTLMAHVWFGKFPDYVAFSILLVWTAATLYMSKLIRTSLFSIIAHIGMAISLCFAFSSGLSYEKLGLLLVYQWVGIAVIVAGNFFFCKKTFLPGLLSSFVLTIIASAFMTSAFIPNIDGLILFGFIGQFICASFLSYFLTLYAKKSELPDAAVLVHVSNKLLWLASLGLNVLNVTFHYIFYINSWNYTLSKFVIHRQGIYYLTVVGLIVIFAHIVITLIMARKFNLSKTLETISVSFLSTASAVLLIYNFYSSMEYTSLLFALAVFMFLLYKLQKSKVYLIFANIWICADVFCMISNGYDELESLSSAAPLLYLLMLLILMTGQWFFLNKNEKENAIVYRRRTNCVKIISYILTHISLVRFIDEYSDLFNDIWLTFLFVMFSLNIILYLFKFERSSKALHVIMKTAESLLIVTAAVYFSNEGNLIVPLLVFGLALTRSFADYKKESLQSAVMGVAEWAFLIGAAVYINIEDSALLVVLTLLISLVFLLVKGFLEMRGKKGYVSSITDIGGIILFIGAAIGIIGEFYSPWLSIAVIALSLTFVLVRSFADYKNETSQSAVMAIAEWLVIAAVSIYIVIIGGKEALMVIIPLLLSFAFLTAKGVMEIKGNKGYVSVITDISGTILFTGAAIGIIGEFYSPWLTVGVIILSLIFALVRSFADYKNGTSQSAVMAIAEWLIIAAVSVYVVFAGRKEAFMFIIPLLGSLAFLALKGVMEIKGKKGCISVLTDISGTILFIGAAICIIGGFYSPAVTIGAITLSLMFVLIRSFADYKGGRMQSAFMEISGLIIILACSIYINSNIPVYWRHSSFSDTQIEAVVSVIAFITCAYAFAVRLISVKDSGAPSLMSRVNELVLLTAFGIHIASYGRPFVVIAAYALALVGAYRDIREESHPFLQIYSGLKLTVLTLCTVHGFTSWLQNGYAVSIIIMITGLASVLAGFRFKAKILRVYGLVITMLCVIKLVTADVSGLSTPMRVVALISGGLICFGINAAYNYAVKVVSSE